MDSETTIEEKAANAGTTGLGSRHGQMFLMFLGLLVAYALRVNLSVGIVAMTDNSSNPEFPKMDWNSQQKGNILSSFFWGYMVLQIPAGLLARRFGPCYLLSGSLIFCGIITALTPLAASKGGWILIMITRILQGLGQGFIYPCINTHMSKWTVPQERGRLFSFVFGGTQLGSIITLVVGGILAASDGGWPSIFYVSGGVGILWGILCAIYGADSPEKHRSISLKEKEFIQGNLIHTTKDCENLPTPWKDISTSVPLIALLLCHLGQNWGFWTLLTLMPTYIAGVLHFDIKQNGLWSALPYLAMWILSFILPFIAEYLLRKQIISVNVSRKLWNSIAHYGGAVALIILGFVTEPVAAVALLVVAVSLNAGCYMGYLMNHIDLSPNFAGTLMGITNGLANITSITAPIIAGLITTDESNPQQWQLVFLISAAIFIIGNTIFIIFGSTEVQLWNKAKEK